MAKYTDDELQALGEKGHAFKNVDGHYSYPIDDEDDLDNAIHAVGRGGADHDAIRKYIIGRAKDLGKSDAIPENWNADGSLQEEKSSPVLGRVKKRRRRSGPVIGREFRFFSAQGLQVRSASDGSDQIEITGMPIVYNTPYAVRDMFGEFEETMLPGVATDVLANGADVRFLFNHDGMPLARTLSGTLQLSDTRTGLGMSAFLDARSSLANDLAVAIEREDVNQMSCGFVVGQDQWSADQTQRSISKFEQLFDVSAVTYPASPTTSVELALRSLWSRPVESQARTRQLWVEVGRDLRAGKPLSTENAGHLQSALDALSSADDIDIPSIVKNLQSIDDALDGGQAGLSHVLGKVNPDGSAKDLEPALVPPNGESTSEPPDGTESGSTDPAPAAAQDGTGARNGIPSTAAERRDADRSFNDVQRAVNDAICKTYGNPDDVWCDIWLEDCGDDWCVFHSWETTPGVGLWRISYSLDADGLATLGDDLTEVVEQTSYVPVERSKDPALSLVELEMERLRMRGRRNHAVA